MTLDPATKEFIWSISLFSVIAGAIIASVAQAFNGWRERIAARKRHLRELAVTLALEQWKRELAVEEASRPQFVKGLDDSRATTKPARPLRVVVFEMLRFADAISDSGLTAHVLADHITDTSGVLNDASKQLRSPKT